MILPRSPTASQHLLGWSSQYVILHSNSVLLYDRFDVKHDDDDDGDGDGDDGGDADDVVDDGDG